MDLLPLSTSLPDPSDLASIFAKMQAKIDTKNERTKEVDRDCSKRYRKIRQETKPFIGCDGEGSGIDAFGRQDYLVFRMGDRELCTGKRLETQEIFEHILAAPEHAIHVGFSFGYDSTQILRYLPEERLKRLLKEQVFDPTKPKSLYTFWDDYGIDYLPRNHLRVCRLERSGKKKVVVPKSARTIFEVFGFFQGSFLSALQSFGVSKEIIEEIAAQKVQRADFNALDQTVRDYCAKECELLAQMMEQLREKCLFVGYVPKKWTGAGQLAKAMFGKWGTMKREDVEQVVPPEVLKMANDAYYGGRFEVTRIGPVDGPVYEYDINSAYPDAMTRLPCLLHGTWEPIDETGRRKAHRAGELYVADVRFNHRQAMKTPLGGLPMRSKQGRIAWKSRGNGVYWSCEIKSAEKLGTRIVGGAGGFRFIPGKGCKCEPFAPLKEVYEYRKELEREQKNKGMPLKLGINAAYGSLAQRVGNGKYKNFVWAGLITAMTRAKLMDAMAQSPENVVMVATDGIYSKVPLDLDTSPGLGNWELKVFDEGLFIVMPGIYWDRASEQGQKLKTRGISANFLVPRRELFEKKWAAYAHYRNSAWVPEYLGIPKVPVTVTQFIGLKLADARGKLETAGKWVTSERIINMDWGNKRGELLRWEGNAAVVAIRKGQVDERTYVHGAQELQQIVDGMDLEHMEVDDQPDYPELNNYF